MERCSRGQRSIHLRASSFSTHEEADDGQDRFPPHDDVLAEEGLVDEVLGLDFFREVPEVELDLLVREDGVLVLVVLQLTSGCHVKEGGDVFDENKFRRLLRLVEREGRKPGEWAQKMDCRTFPGVERQAAVLEPKERRIPDHDVVDEAK
jgi:hypothetical protein